MPAVTGEQEGTGAMETETNQPQVQLRTQAGRPDRIALTLPAADRGGWPRALNLSAAELQAIVQAAYDQHGILAQPWHAEPPRCNGTAHCIAERHHSGCAWALARQAVTA